LQALKLAKLHVKISVRDLNHGRFFMENRGTFFGLTQIFDKALIFSYGSNS